MMECLVCFDTELQKIYSNKNQFLYTQGVVKSLNDWRLFRKQELNYYFCKNCGFIFNPNPMTSKNDITYKELYTLNPQNLSVKDITSLKKKFNTIFVHSKLKKDSKILEIGSNDGYFLNFFFEKQIQCTGIDPSPAVDICRKKYPGIKVIQDYYSSHIFNEEFDLIICRNVIEHLNNPIEFIMEIKKNLKHEGYAYFEVPNVEKFIAHRIYTNFYHEHISYFFKELFEEINNSLGFKTIFIENISDNDVITYFGQNATTTLNYKLQNIPKLDNINPEIEQFIDSFKSFKMKIKEFFKDFIKKRFTIGLWGAGCTSINIISLLNDLIPENIYLYDSAETKIGYYLPGLNKKINSPIKILENNPDVIIIMSERYKSEIYEKLIEMNYTKEVWSIFPKIEKLN